MFLAALLFVFSIATAFVGVMVLISKMASPSPQAVFALLSFLAMTIVFTYSARFLWVRRKVG